MSTNDTHEGRQFQSGSEPDFLRHRVASYFNQSDQGNHPSKKVMSKISTPRADAVMLCTCDYLSLSNHPAIVRAQTDSLLKNGNGLIMSMVYQPEQSSQYLFEKKMAKFVGKEDCLLCQSGWAANVGLVQSIADEKTPVYVDMMAHMSLQEGVVSAGAKAHIFRHNNPESLEKLIKRHGRGIILIESIYSTHGDIAPLKDFADISERYGCILVVDESHSLGTHGPDGNGLVAELGLLDKVQFITASLGKTFVGRGGVIVTTSRYVEYIRFESKPTIFSTAVLPHEADAFSATIDVITNEKWRRSKLQRNAYYLKTHLLNLGYNVTESQSQVIALEAGLINHTNHLNNLLEAKAVHGAVFWEPATPKNRSLLRLSVNAALSKDQLNHVVAACYAVRDKVNLDQWSSTKRLTKQRAKQARSNQVYTANSEEELRAGTA